MYPVQCRGLTILLEFNVRGVHDGLPASASTANLRHALLLQLREEQLLIVAAGIVLDQVGNCIGSIFTEELLGPFRDGHKSHHALFRLDDTTLPLGQVDPEGLGETTRHVEDKAVTLGFSTGCGVFFVFLVFSFGIAVTRFAVGALERPEEERGKSSILFDRPGRAVSSLCLGRAENLLQG